MPENAKDTANNVMAIGMTPVGKSPSRVKLLNPMLWLCSMCSKPRIAPPPIIKNTMTVTTLTRDNQNSVSANKRTEITLVRNTKPANSALQIHTGVSGNQRTIKIPAAVNSEPMATVQVSQYSQATVYPVPGPRKRVA
ncbi:hypothetical protein D3C85_863490 [compost metagenome]